MFIKAFLPIIAKKQFCENNNKKGRIATAAFLS
jgi:hypothetical protein